ncbi:TPA: hypothetical protein ACU9NN_004100, partial [Enterobacter asburiae]
NRSHWSTSKTPSYTKSVSWQHHQFIVEVNSINRSKRASVQPFSYVFPLFIASGCIMLMSDEALLHAAFDKESEL